MRNWPSRELVANWFRIDPRILLRNQSNFARRLGLLDRGGKASAYWDISTMRASSIATNQRQISAALRFLPAEGGPEKAWSQPARNVGSGLVLINLEKVLEISYLWSSPVPIPPR